MHKRFEKETREKYNIHDVIWNGVYRGKCLSCIV